MNNKSILLMVSISLNVAFLIALFVIFANQQTQPTAKPFTAVIQNGWNWSSIECDSFKMVSKTQSVIYYNGIAMPIVGDEIRINTNEQ